MDRFGGPFCLISYEPTHKNLSGSGQTGVWFCMEATGAYHLPLAEYLHDAKEKVSVANPLQVVSAKPIDVPPKKRLISRIFFPFLPLILLFPAV